MKTSGQQTLEFGEDELICSQEGFHANHSVHQEKERELQMIDTSGRKCLEQFERFGRVGSWAKTFAALLIGTGEWYSTRRKLSWKLRGTKSSRFYFLLQVLAPRISEIESGLLHTPRTIHATMKLEMKDKNHKRFRKNDLMNLSLLPTPSASDNRDRGGPSTPAVQRRMEIGKQVGLTMMVDGQLNPLFVQEMMGFPPGWLTLPFQGGDKKV